MTPTLVHHLARVILPYLIFGGLWILVSDRTLDELALDPATRARWSDGVWMARRGEQRA